MSKVFSYFAPQVHQQVTLFLNGINSAVILTYVHNHFKKNNRIGLYVFRRVFWSRMLSSERIRS